MEIRVTIFAENNCMDIRVKVGERLRFLRKKQDLSQAQLAVKCELDKSYLASIEQGRRNVSIVNIEKISQALGITISDFCKWEAES